MAKVLLVMAGTYNPKHVYKEYPLGIGYIGTLLKLHEHEVKIYDQNVEGIDIHALTKLISGFDPNIIGFSVITPNYPTTAHIVRQIKEKFPDIFLIAGGIHANLFPHDLLNDGIDIVVLGEGEKTTLELVTCIEKGQDLGSLSGIAYINTEQEYIIKEALPIRHSLEDLPMVDRSLYKLDLYERHSMLASRGCNFKCRFCCNYTGTILTNGVLIRNHTRVIEEMSYLSEKFNAKEIFFVDDVFLVKRNNVLSFCHELIESHIPVRWTGQMRVDLITREIAEAMYEAKCHRVFFGVESGSEHILKNVKKGLTTDKIVEGIAYAKSAGIRVKTGWIYGLPGSLEEQYKSVDLMVQTRPHEISIHQLIPFPGTTYYIDRNKYGIRIREPKDFKSFAYGGLGGNISFDYMSQNQLLDLLRYTETRLESEGYVNSDNAQPNDEYVYSTPLSMASIENAIHQLG